MLAVVLLQIYLRGNMDVTLTCIQVYTVYQWYKCIAAAFRHKCQRYNINDISIFMSSSSKSPASGCIDNVANESTLCRLGGKIDQTLQMSFL